MDENLLHVGKESLLCGVCPTYSPRYFTYLHHQDKKVSSKFTFKEFVDCEADCLVYDNDKMTFHVKKLKNIFSMMDRYDNELESETFQRNWIAGVISFVWDGLSFIKACL